ncbi:MAG: hypothetical protein WKG00_23415 [Polyangiaceae bacterium]
MPAETTPGPRSLRALREQKRPVRRPASVEEIPLDQVPMVETTPLDATAPREATGEVAPEVVRRDGGVAVLGLGFGSFSVGWVGPVPIAEPADAEPRAAGSTLPGQIAIDAWHFRGGDPWVRAEWLAMVQGEGGPEVIWAHGWYGWRSGQTRVERRIRTPVRAAAGGMAYVFRARCPSCALGQRDVLQVVLPGPGFSQAPIGIEPIALSTASGGSVIRAVSRQAVARLRALAPELPAGKDLVLGVEVTRAIGEAQSTVLVRVREAPPDRAF